MKTLTFRRNNILVGFILGTILSLVLGFVTGFAVFGQIALMVAIPMMVISLGIIIIAYMINRFGGTRVWPVSHLMRPKNVGGTVANVCIMDVLAFLIAFMMVSSYYIRGANMMMFCALTVLFLGLFFAGILATLCDAMPSKSSQQIITAFEDMFQDVGKTIDGNNINNVVGRTRQEVERVISE